MKDKPTYKEQNGTTRVGDFLRAIGKSDLLKSIVDSAKKMGVPFLDVVQDILLKNEELSKAEKEHALKILQYDITEAQEISKRWTSDMLSDSFLSKNIRPIILLYSWVLITMMIFFRNEINEAYIKLIETIAFAVNIAYFGGRSVTKMFKLKK